MSQSEIEALTVPGELHNFADITDHQEIFPVVDLALEKKLSASAIPTRPVQQARVGAIIRDQLCSSGDCTRVQWNMVETLSTVYPTRWHTQPTGRMAVEWLRGRYVEAAGSRLGQDVTIQVFDHAFGPQPSLIVSIRGSTLPNQIVIAGGHIDSVAGPPAAPAPGADDDASGSATVFSAFQALMQANFRPDRTVEFHAYAAEEAGLLGSADVAASYRQRNANVISMVQFDMVCYSQARGSGNARRVGITRDFTDLTLSNFVIQLIQAYTNIGFAESTCGYACSDHGSWNRNRYPAAFPFEAPFGQHNPDIHTTRDTLANCDRQYMGEFAKLAIGYLVEVGLSATSTV